MSVQAKFTVVGVTKRKGWSGHDWVYDIEMNPVTGTSEENKSFFASTPGGNIKLMTLNETAAEHFVPGASYYVKFQKAD